MRLSSFDIILIEEVYLDINTDYFRRFDMEELCQKYKLRKEKLVKGFQEIYGTDICEYYREMCMEYAREEFEKGTTLKDLSFVFDYKSVQKFSMEFKAYLRQSRQ